jgi:hypothetical protein
VVKTTFSDVCGEDGKSVSNSGFLVVPMNDPSVDVGCSVGELSEMVENAGKVESEFTVVEVNSTVVS